MQAWWGRFAPVSLAMLLVASSAIAQVSFAASALARVGGSAPVPSQLVQVSSPYVSDGGQVAFVGDGGVFLQSKGTTTVVVGFGDPAPGGGNLIAGGSGLVNEVGEVAFIGTVGAPGRSGIFLWSDGNVRAIAQAGDPVPQGGVFNDFNYLAMKGAGSDVTIAFTGVIATPWTEERLFLLSLGVLRQMAGAGDPAPGGGTFAGFLYPSVNLSRQVAFAGHLNPGHGAFVAHS